jgi:hypothetical protein
MKSAGPVPMAEETGNGQIGRIEVLRALQSATRFFRSDERIRLLQIREAEITAFLKTIGVKAKTRWEADSDVILARLLSGIGTIRSAANEVVVGIRIGESTPLVEIATTEDPDLVMQELGFKLRWLLAGDRKAKREVDRFDRRRDDEQRQIALRKRESGVERITLRIDHLRRGIATLAPLFGIDTWALDEIGGLKNELESIRQVRKNLSSWRTRSGNIDAVVEKVLHEFDLFSIHDAPRLLSAVGYLVDSGDCLAVLQVRSDYRKHLEGRRDMLNLQLFAGYRPHTDIIRELPRCLFDHPGYIAPVEDLLDWLAVDFYAGKKSGQPEDGAVGWLLHSTSENLNNPANLLNDLAEESRYWTVERLRECLTVWNEIVGPVRYLSMPMRQPR